MSRIRSIHPGLQSDEAYMSMSMTAKAGWPLLWTECDDHGVFEWKPIVLKARIFPADNVDFDALLTEYERLGQVRRFEAEGRQYGVVRNFCKYQKPKNPSYRFPFHVEQLSTFIGLKAANSDTPPPALPQPSPSPPEKSAQMEEGVGRGKIEPIAQRSETARAALPENWLDRSLEANGIVGFREERAIGLMNPAPIIGLLEAGFDFERDWLAGIRAKPNPKARTWGYFEPQVRDFAGTRDRAASVPKPAAPIEDWAERMRVWNESRTWGAWGPQPGDRGCRVPAEFLTRTAA